MSFSNDISQLPNSQFMQSGSYDSNKLLEELTSDVLNEEYKLDPNPSNFKINRLSKVLRCSTNYIQDWFDEQRAKENQTIPDNHLIQSSLKELIKMQGTMPGTRTVGATKDSIEQYSKEPIKEGINTFRRPTDYINIDHIDEEIDSSMNSSLSSTSLNAPQKGVSLYVALLPFLNSKGKLSDGSCLSQVFKILASRSNESDRGPFLDLMERTPEILSSIAYNVKILSILRIWTIHAHQQSSNLLARLLSIIEFLPLALEDLISTKLGKMIELILKNTKDNEIRSMVVRIKENWKRRFAKEDGKRRASEDFQGSVNPIPIPSPNPNLKIVSSSSSSTTLSASTSTTTSATASITSSMTPSTTSTTTTTKKLKKPTLPTPSEQKKPVMAISSLDFMKTFSTPSNLPTIKKTDKPRPKTPSGTGTLMTIDPSKADEESVLSNVSHISNTTTPSVFSYKRTRPAEEEEPEKGKEKKKRKSVSFKPDDLLVEIRYFDSNLEEEHGIAILKYASPKDFERSEGRIAFGKKIRDELIATRDWQIPIELDFGNEAFTWARNSTECSNQERREQQVFSTIFFTEKDIPMSPAEPDESDMGIPIKLSMIPCDDLAGLSEQVVQNLIPSRIMQPPMQQQVWNNNMSMQQQQSSFYQSIQPVYSSQPQPLPVLTNQHPPLQSNHPQPFQQFQQSQYGNSNGNSKFNSLNSTEKCRFWQKGNCKFGDKCHYSHAPR